MSAMNIDTETESNNNTFPSTPTSTMGIRKRRRLRQQKKRLRERNRKVRRLEKLSKEKVAESLTKLVEIPPSTCPSPCEVKVIPKNLGLCDICFCLYNKKHMDRHKSVCDGSGKWCRYRFI